MQEGFRKGIKKDIAILENYLKKNEETISEELKNEVLDKLGNLYELLKMFE